MPLYDQHLHSRHSMDSQAEPADNVEAAIAGGLAGLTFTEHFDTHADDWPDCVYDDESYTATIERLRSRYGDRIFIGKGIEVCYQPDRMDFILDFLNRHSFDVVLISVHYFAGKALHRRELWAEVSPLDGSRCYLEGVLDAVQCCRRLAESGSRVFDVLSHLDLCKRYTQRYFDSHDVSPCAEIIDEILINCLAADLVPEINTSSLRQNLSETMPADETVVRYAKLGGVAMSLGSDAHRATDVGAGLDHAAAMLNRAGINHIAVFTNRTRTMVSVE